MSAGGVDQVTRYERPTGRVPGRTPVRVGPLSGVWRPRTVGVTLVGLVLLGLVAAVNVGRGDFPISVSEVLAVLFGGGDRADRFVVLELRLPRTLTGLLVGAALGLSGAITQVVARNPLASPDILGVTAGGSAAAVAVIVLGGGSVAGGGLLAEVGLPVAALVGGLGTAALVYLLAYRRGLDGYRLVLVGVGVGALAAALANWLLVVAEIDEAARGTVWLVGSLYARGWEHVLPVGLALVVLVPVALLLAFPLGALQLGDDTARGLGLRLNRVRAGLVTVAVGLAAVATASAGPVAFVALVVPQICQRLVGAARPPLLASAVYGALLTVAADLLARTALGVELPVGVVTAILGAPYLLHLLVRGNRRVSV
ncbi:FecCD family ABC transporter permease [Micromonospora echinospora]